MSQSNEAIPYFDSLIKRGVRTPIPDVCWDCEHHRQRTCPHASNRPLECKQWVTNPAVEYGDSPTKKRALASVDRFIHPPRVTEEMVRLASGDGKFGPLPLDSWHIAANLNAMLEFGYCPKCKLCPNGCHCNDADKA